MRAFAGDGGACGWWEGMEGLMAEWKAGSAKSLAGSPGDHCRTRGRWRERERVNEVEREGEVEGGGSLNGKKLVVNDAI